MVQESPDITFATEAPVDLVGPLPRVASMYQLHVKALGASSSTLYTTATSPSHIPIQDSPDHYRAC